MNKRQTPEVLDASALLAWLQQEEGHQNVRLQGRIMNTVNWSEVVQKSLPTGIAPEELLTELEALGLSVHPFSATEAAAAARLFESGAAAGLSLADRCCLASAAVRGGVAITADRAWGRLDSGVAVRLIR